MTKSARNNRKQLTIEIAEKIIWRRGIKGGKFDLNEITTRRVFSQTPSKGRNTTTTFDKKSPLGYEKKQQNQLAHVTEGSLMSTFTHVIYN